MTEIDHGFTTDMKYGIAGTFTGGLSSKGLRLLKNEWYNVNTVYPICEDQTEIEGLKSYPSINELPEPIDVLIVVHKKELTTEVVRQASTLEKKPAIWFMPGTISPESIAICEDNNMKYSSSCIMGHRQFSGLKRVFNMHSIHGYVAGMNKIPKQG